MGSVGFSTVLVRLCRAVSGVTVLTITIWKFVDRYGRSSMAVGVQLHPDSPILMIHCQDPKKIPRPRGLVSWIGLNSPASSPTHQVLGASTVCRTSQGSASPTVSDAQLQRSGLRSRSLRNATRLFRFPGSRLYRVGFRSPRRLQSLNQHHVCFQT